MLIDIHGHDPKTSGADFFLYCHADLKTPLPKAFNPSTHKLSVGLHPWFLPTNWEEGRELLDNWTTKNQIHSFGECGLDRLRGPELSLQGEFLLKQLEYAQSLKMPFVTLHCVRAFPEMMAVLKESTFKGKILFHDFGGNPDITAQLIKKENIYFSLYRILERSKESEKLNETLKFLPLERIFLETDDSHLSIESQYHLASQVLAIPMSELITQIEDNLKSLTS